MDINKISNKTENKTQLSNYEEPNLEMSLSSLDTSKSCGVLDVQEETCDFVISNIKQEADVFSLPLSITLSVIILNSLSFFSDSFRSLSP